MYCTIQLLYRVLTVGTCLQITCPDGYQACGGMCYRLYDGSCPDGGLYPVPMTQQEITCLLDFTDDSSLPVFTGYWNLNGVTFTSRYDDSVAPSDIVGTPGPGNVFTYQFVIIDRASGQLVASVNLFSSGWVKVCELPPVV